jgi:hypothetical protein
MSKLLVFALILGSLPLFAKDSPFACNLSAFTAQERKRHFEELSPALRRLRTGVRELPNGYAFRFPSDAKTFGMLTEWIEQERRCCPFFDISLQVEREGGPLWMQVTGRPGTKQFIEAEAKEWIKR